MMDKPNEICSSCGAFAGFEKSPEGECCGVCREWVCGQCVDNKVSMKEFILPTGERIAEEIICKKCSTKLNLNNLIPVREL